MSFADLIREAREEKGFTKRKLAEEANVTDVYITLIEQGNRIPSDEKCIALADALGIDRAKVLFAANQEAKGGSPEAKEVFDAALFFRDAKGLNDKDREKVVNYIRDLKNKKKK